MTKVSRMQDDQDEEPVGTDTETPEPFRYGPLNEMVRYLWMAEKCVAYTFHNAMGTRSGRYTALTLIDENPGLSQKALADAAGRDKSTLSLALADLAREGLVEKTRSDDDRRTSKLSLTRKGKERLQTLQAFMATIDADLEKVVGDRGEEFLQTLKDIVAAFGDTKK